MVNLQKGGNVNLTKSVDGLKKALIGLGWNKRTTTGEEFDLDALFFMVDENGKVISDDHFIYYNNKVSPCGGIVHKGDNRDGAASGDDEQVDVDFSKLDSRVKKVVCTVNIHEAALRNQNFGQVSNAYIHITSGDFSARFDLSEDASLETAMVFGELYNHNGEWKFKAIGQGFNGGLVDLCRSYGVSV